MIKIFKTFEIDEELWGRIVSGFNESFDRNVSVESFKSGFCVSNQLGYGFHAIAFDDESGDIMAFNTYSPSFYKGGLNVMVSGSTYVKSKYRKDIFLFYDLLTALRNKAKEEGYVVEIGIPNHNSRDYAKKLLKTQYVADLDYYILPKNVSIVLEKSSLRSLDGVFRFLFNFHLLIQRAMSTILNFNEKQTKYSLITDADYYRSRFKSPAYSKYETSDYLGYYKMVDEKGKRVAYVFDFRYLGIRTRKALTKMVQHIFRNENPDAILFVGFLHLRQYTLIKVPRRFIPKPLPLTYYVLDKKRKEEFKDLGDKKNWDFGLMNFDVR